ncbi:MAG: hypothetical protein HC781_09215 [Leptolyngbyaceae cyanobacterium CSU_1_4]|nr:hypothetical protein [Leptolyngbyaceae cyanobacterium CSU_1_4]
MNQRISSALAFCGFLLLGSVFPAVAADPVQANSSPALQKLMMMFSTEIKTTLNACREQGGVDLAAGAQVDGSVLCANGEPKATIPYDNYLNTVSDVAAAVGLVGLKTVITGNPSVSPEMMVTFLTSPNGIEALKNAVQTAIARSSLIPIASPESTTVLAEQIIGRLHSSGNPANRSSSCISAGCRPSRIASTISGASSVSRRTRLT